MHPTTPATSANDEINVPANAKVLYTEVGYASWYGPGFQKRNAANGQPYDMNAMTAAHRTLPLNTIARVTDVKTGDSVLLRITDRGPFVGDRVIDLSRAAARRLSVFQKGVALVRIEVLETPSPIKEGGRWCVQIGAFSDSRDASQLKEKLHAAIAPPKCSNSPALWVATGCAFAWPKTIKSAPRKSCAKPTPTPGSIW